MSGTQVYNLAPYPTLKTPGGLYTRRFHKNDKITVVTTAIITAPPKTNNTLACVYRGLSAGITFK